MKRIAKLVLSLAGLMCLADLVAAQGPTPVISSVPFRKAYNPGNIVIKGSSLGLVTTVKLNNVSLPILHISSTQIVAGPAAPQDPGFGTVMVSGGTASASAPIELTPSLKVVKRANRMDITVRNGDAGSFVVRASYVQQTGVADDGIYYLRLLGGSYAYNPVVAIGGSVDDQPVKITGVLVPIEIGFSGVSLKLQGQSSIGVGAFASYTNLTSIPGYGM